MSVIFQGSSDEDKDLFNPAAEEFSPRNDCREAIKIPK
jgi:hypothetical protein